MKIFKRIIKIVLIVGLIVALIFLGRGCYKRATYSNTVEYQLTEFGDGIYGYYNAVTSNIPAENYEMIVLCLNGQVYTLKGNVNIHYTNSGNYKLIWTDVNLVHGDTFEVYVPAGSIEMRPNLVQS